MLCFSFVYLRLPWLPPYFFLCLFGCTESVLGCNHLPHSPQLRGHTPRAKFSVPTHLCLGDPSGGASPPHVPARLCSVSSEGPAQSSPCHSMMRSFTFSVSFLFQQKGGTYSEISLDTLLTRIHKSELFTLSVGGQLWKINSTERSPDRCVWACLFSGVDRAGAARLPQMHPGEAGEFAGVGLLDPSAGSGQKSMQKTHHSVQKMLPSPTPLTALFPNTTVRAWLECHIF